MFDYKTNNPFAYIYEKICKSSFKNPYTIFIFQVYDLNRCDKFSVLRRFLKNSIHTINEKNTMISLFGKTQAVLNVFMRFYKNHCYKKAIKYNCNYDLTLEPMFNLREKQKFTFIQENTKFIFSNQDMIKLIKNGLLTHDNFFTDPQMPKNPYTNLHMNKYILYNFYFHLKENNFKVPVLFERFFDNAFDIHNFYRKNESFLREMVIDNYPNQLTIEELYEEIIMFLRVIHMNVLYIHIDFPKKQVINAFTKIYLHYLHSRFDLTEENRRYNRDKMKDELNRFIVDNKTFGRVIMTRLSQKTPHSHYKISNILSSQIPNFQSIQNVYEYMEHGIEMYLVEDDDDVTEDEFDLITSEQIDDLLDSDVEMEPVTA